MIVKDLKFSLLLNDILKYSVNPNMWFKKLYANILGIIARKDKYICWEGGSIRRLERL